MQIPLTDGWTVTATAGPVPDTISGAVPAAVPGCVHLDLLAAGLIPDPYLDRNEESLAWIGRVEWRYESSFDWAGADDGDQVDLVALGLDTVATVELNGSVVASTANMHRSYRFPVGHLLQPGRNTIAVTFAPGLDEAERRSEELGPRPHVNAHPFNALRKMACNFGWDWGPDLVTAGIWRPMFLETWRVARIDSVRPLTEIDGTTGVLRTHVDVQRVAGDDTALSVDVTVAGSTSTVEVPAGQSSVVVETRVADVELWWPHGYGEQPLYDVEVTLSGDGRLSSWSGRVGFRSIVLDTTPDADGTPFAFAVNGVPLFVRGANWIPDDCFLPRVTRERYDERLRQAKAANVNMLRVWGGGVYESDDFYDLCDEHGILVWQDFLFACAAYTEDEPLRSEVVAEAREAVTRLTPHPSLALWNGCNENIWGREEWGWKEPLGDLSWGWGYYTEVLPAIIAELDPARPYSPGSPYSMTPDLHPNEPSHGTMHIWDVWNDRDYTVYRDYRPRFCSEFGFQGPPTWATLTRAVHDQPLESHSPGMLAHQKAEDGNGKLDRGLRTHLPVPASFEDWHWATSLNQARAIACGIEHFRSWSPLCRGSIVWQLNDCWPVSSWAAIDGDARLKPMWYAMRRSYRDRLVTVQPRDGGLAVVAVNDTGDQWTGSLQVIRHGFDGSVLAKASLPYDIEPRGAVTLALPAEVATPDDASTEVLLVEAADQRAWWQFAEDVDAALPAQQVTTTVTEVEGGYLVEVRAEVYLHDVALLADRLAGDATVDDMLVTLLPGDTARFLVRTTGTLSADVLSGPAVLRSANQLVSGG